jgi:hypothetical protein
VRRRVETARNVKKKGDALRVESVALLLDVA